MSHKLRTLLLSAKGNLAGRDHEIYEEILASLESKHHKTRIGAALALGHIQEASSVEPLLSAFRTDDPSLGAAVAWALGECGSLKSIALLTTAVKLGFVVENACEALGKIGDLQAQETLLKVCRNESLNERAYAAKSLGMLDYQGSSERIEQSLMFLTKLLKDRGRKVRLCAVYSIDVLTYGAKK